MNGFSRNKDIADRIKLALKATNKSQWELAEHLDITPQAVSSWGTENPSSKTGDRYKGPQIDRFEEIANFLGVTPQWIFGDISDDQEINNQIKEIEEIISCLSKEKYEIAIKFLNSIK